MMVRGVAIGLALGLLVAAPALAEDDFCSTLKAAWTVAKTDPKALDGRQIAGATLCTRLDGGLQCSWLLGTRENGRATFDRFRSDAAACMKPLGLVATAMSVAGSETSLLEGSGADPAVAIIYPGNATVTVTLIVPD